MTKETEHDSTEGGIAQFKFADIKLGSHTTTCAPPSASRRRKFWRAIPG